MIHQFSVSVLFKQLVALIDYGMEFWHRILQVAGKVILGVSARITFGLMLHSKWLMKCCVAISIYSCVTMLCFVWPTVQSIVHSKNWNIREFYVIIDSRISMAPGLKRKRLRLLRSLKTLFRPWWDKNALALIARPLANAISIIMIVAMHIWLGKFQEAHFE